MILSPVWPVAKNLKFKLTTVALQPRRYGITCAQHCGSCHTTGDPKSWTVVVVTLVGKPLSLLKHKVRLGLPEINRNPTRAAFLSYSSPSTILIFFAIPGS